MKTKRYLPMGTVVLAGLAFFLCLSAAVKQVRVIAERAIIYAEPSRTSSRIETVEKGTILNLFQERKVRNVWYYVSFQSSRFGSRISGFVHESAVEPVGEEKPLLPKKKEPSPTPPPRPKIEEKKEPERALAATPLPKARSLKLPRQEPQLKENIWKPILAATPLSPAKPKEVEAEKPLLIKPIEIIIKTPLTRGRTIASPRQEKPWEEIAWQVVSAPSEEKKREAEKAPPRKSVSAPLPPSKPKKEETGEKPAVATPAKPAVPEPIQTPIKPSGRPAQPRKRGLLTVGLGYGPSLGGAGGLVQLNTSFGFSVHAGLGIYPTTLIYSETDWVKNEILYSMGVKYYFPFKTSSFFPYLDVQYGGLKVEAAQMVLGIYEFTYVLGHEQRTLQGLSALLGTELRRDRFGLNGAFGLGYILTDWKFLRERVSLAFDVGILIYF